MELKHFLTLSGTSTTLTATHAFVAILTNHPELQRRLQMEVDKTLRGREPKLIDKHTMPLLEAVCLFVMCLISQHTPLFVLNW